MAEDVDTQDAPDKVTNTDANIPSSDVSSGDVGISGTRVHPRTQYFSLDVPPGADLEEPQEPEKPSASAGPDRIGTQGNLPEWVTQEHLELARNYRLNPEHLAYFKSEEAFLNAVDEHNRRMLQAGMAYMQQPVASQYGAQLTQDQTADSDRKRASEPERKEGQQSEPDYLPDFYFKPNIDKDTYGDELATELGKMSEHYAKQLTRLAASVQQLTHWLGQHRYMLDQTMQRTMQDAQKQQWLEIERSIHDMGPEYRQVFGKLSDAKPGSTEHQNWMRLYHEMKKLEAGYLATNSPMPSYTELARAAVRIAMPDLITKVERNRVVEQARSRQKGFVSRAYQVPKSEEPNRLLQAAKRIDEFRRSHGLG